MLNALSFDIEDWFQVENLKGVISYDKWDNFELRVVNNTEKILSILREANTKATFFILGWIAERCPGLVEEVSRQGHEIASHGYSHELVYKMTEDAFSEDIRKSKEILEGIAKKKIIGYRAPSFSITKDSLWAIDILKKHGFKYDSSIFPIQFHNRYGFNGCGEKPFHWQNGLFEIPLATYKLGNVVLPLAGGGYFRLLPYYYFRYFLKKLNNNNNPFTFYLHPWELDPKQPRISLPLFYRFRHYVNLKTTENYLKRLIKDFNFESIAEVYNIKT